MSKTKAIFLVALANIVFWGGFALSLYFATTTGSRFFQMLSIMYVEVWLLLGVCTYGLYRLLRKQL